MVLKVADRPSRGRYARRRRRGRLRGGGGQVSSCVPRGLCLYPLGLEWCYGGSGLADLALSVLADAPGRKLRPVPLPGIRNPEFKWDVAAGVNHEG